jgi:parallel beta-helix repeat protein
MYPGDTFSIEIEFSLTHSGAGNENHFCFYFKNNEFVGNATWASLTTSMGDTYTKDADGTTLCPAVTGYSYEVLYSMTAPTLGDFGADDQFTINVTIGNPAAGDYLMGVKQYNDADTDGTPATLENTVSQWLEIKASPSKVYVSDLSTCGGYAPCYHSLSAAIDALGTTGTEVVIIGTLTADGGGATVPSSGNGSAITSISGDSTPKLKAPSGCTGAPLTINKSGVTISDFTIDGSSCSGGKGLVIIAAGATVDNMTVQDFSSGTGIEFSGSGAGTVKNCVGSIENNSIGVDIQSTAGAVSVGTGPTDGNTFSGNTIGIKVNDTSAVIKGNTISGGTTGIQLLVVPSTLPLGNSVTGASGYQIDCAGGAGAAFNYLGSSSPSGGSNCSDVNDQLGAAIQGWADSNSYGSVSVIAGSNQSVFQLADDPYNVGSGGEGDLTAFYAVRTDGTPAVTHSGGMTQTKMLMAGTGCFPMSNRCWDSATDEIPRAQTGKGYYAIGSVDPNAVTLANITASSANTWLAVGLVVSLSALAMGALFVLRKRRALCSRRFIAVIYRTRITRIISIIRGISSRPCSFLPRISRINTKKREKLVKLCAVWAGIAHQFVADLCCAP